MKKKLLIGVLLLFSFSGIVNAAVNGEFMGYNIVKVVVGGEEKSLSTPAVLMDGKTMFPAQLLRDLGFTVNWDGTTETMTVIPPKPLEPKVVTVYVDKETGETVEPEPDTAAPSSTDEPTPNTETAPAQSGEQPTTPITTTPEPTTSEPVAETPTETTTEPDNAAACQEIRDDYGYQIVMVGYGGGSDGQKRLAVHLLEYERDQALAAAGCN